MQKRHIPPLKITKPPLNSFFKALVNDQLDNSHNKFSFYEVKCSIKKQNSRQKKPLTHCVILKKCLFPKEIARVN